MSSPSLVIPSSDIDNDGILDVDDNCPFNINSNKSDVDNDGLGDICDDDVDNCPVDPNVGQDDTDFDGAGDACAPDDDDDSILDGVDNCPTNPNFDQADQDNDGIGDICDSDFDDDLYDDGVLDSVDNCPTNANPDQNDLDGDGVGDVCDDDIDGDDVTNGSDICSGTPDNVLIDPDNGCSIDQLCPCEGPRGTNKSWKNHGKYVPCVAHAAKGFADKGLISSTEKGDIVSTAAQSNCGNKK